MKTVGIDIGTFSVKVAEVDSSIKTVRLVRMLEFPLSSDPSKDKGIEILDHLRNLVGQYDPENTKFVLGTKQESVSLRYRTFPFRERFKILKSLPFELEDDVPFSQDDAIFDAKIIRHQGPSSEILAVACPKNHVQEFADLASNCGFELSILSLQGFALSNLFENWYMPVPERPVDFQATPEPQVGELIIDIGHKGTVVLAYADGVLIATRHLDWGGIKVAENISSRYSLHVVEALKEMQKKAFILLSPENATKEQILFSDVIRKSIDELATPLRLTMIELQAEFNVKFQSATLLGGTSQIRNFGAYLTQKLELPVNRLRGLERAVGLEITADLPNAVASLTAIGLALEGHKRPRNPSINLLQAEFAKQTHFLSEIAEKWGHTFKIAAASFVFLITYGIFKGNLAEKLSSQAFDNLQQQAQSIAGLTPAKTTVRNIKKFLKQREIEEKGKKLIEKVTEINSALDILKQITGSLQDKSLVIDVRSFHVDNEQVEFSGEMSTQIPGEQLIQRLQSMAIGGKIETITPTGTAKAGKRLFGLKFRVKRTQGG